MNRRNAIGAVVGAVGGVLGGAMASGAATPQLQNNAVNSAQMSGHMGRTFMAQAGGYGPGPIVLRAASGPCSSIKAFDGRFALTLDQDYPTADALRRAVGKPGHYATCLAEGLWRPFGSFNGEPGFEWHAIVATQDQGSSLCQQWGGHGEVRHLSTAIDEVHQAFDEMRCTLASVTSESGV